MKIGFYYTTPFPALRADNIQHVQMCRAFAESGHEVTLYIPRQESFASDDAALYKAENLFGSPLGFNVVFIPRIVLFGRLQTLGSLLSGKRALRHAGCDLIYTRAPWACTFLPRLATAFILETHDDVLHKEYRLVNRTLQKLFVSAARHSNCKLVVAISDTLKELWRKAGVPPSKLITAHDGVDIKLFDNSVTKESARKSLKLEPSRPKIVYTGNIGAHHGIDMILEAAQAFPETDFILIGGTEKEVRLYEKSISNRRLNNVTFTGNIPHHHIPQWLAAADILLLVYTWRVPHIRCISPMKLFEYMAAERPIVCPAFPTLKEVVTDGVDVLMYEPENTESMIAAIHKGLSSSSASVAAAAREKAVQDYTWSVRCRMILREFDK